MKTCSISDCNRKLRCSGYCDLHYSRWLIHGDPKADLPPKLQAKGKTCQIADCESPVRCRMLCALHYGRLMHSGTTDDPTPTKRAICSVSGCESIVHARGYCQAHRQRVAAYGDPLADTPVKFLPTASLRDDIASRILARCTEGPDGCLVWQGGLADGYGSVSWRGRQWRTHLAHWVSVNGPLPGKDWSLDHLCYNRACVNLEHLEPVTRGENTMRAILRKRTGVARIPDEVLDFLRAASAATLDGAHLFDAFKSA